MPILFCTVRNKIIFEKKIRPQQRGLRAAEHVRDGDLDLADRDLDLSEQVAVAAVNRALEAEDEEATFDALCHPAIGLRALIDSAGALYHVELGSMRQDKQVAARLRYTSTEMSPARINVDCPNFKGATTHSLPPPHPVDPPLELSHMVSLSRYWDIEVPWGIGIELAKWNVCTDDRMVHL